MELSDEVKKRIMYLFGDEIQINDVVFLLDAMYNQFSEPGYNKEDLKGIMSEIINFLKHE
jgi:hypothetical protein